MRNEEVAQLNFTDWPVPDRFLTEIGRVTTVWASLESLLNLCIGKLAGFNEPDDPTPYVLVAHSSFPQRVDILATLCEQLIATSPALQDYKTVVSKLKTAQKARNCYSHNTVNYDEESDSLNMPVGSARGKLKVSTEQVSLEDIKRAAIEIEEANRALYKLVLGRELQAAWTQNRSTL